MSQPSVALIRAPYQYKYDQLNVHEEAIITYLMGYFDAIGFDNYRVFDFHLERETTWSDFIDGDFTDFVLPLRETGENTHYVRRIASLIAQRRDEPIWIYGQTARLRHFSDWPKSVHILHHDEGKLAARLGLSGDGPRFGAGLTLSPYIQKMDLAPWQIRRAKGVVETTRGCQFGCSFCFINQGVNYDQRWTVRDNDSIMRDLERYVQLGIRNFVFYDSEFFGRDETHYPARIALLQRIRDELPKLRIKIYARADTLMRFDQFDLLKQAGLVQVFIGAESLHDPDLKALKKGLSASTIVDAIEELKARDIFCNLSFIVFNRNTTAESLRANLDSIDALLQEKSRLLGVPSFTFSFESDWRGKASSDEPSLSDRTYVIHDLRQKEQPVGAQIFNAQLEPLMELFRLLSYEWNKKLTRLNLARDTTECAEDLSRIERWFVDLPRFCLDTMRDFIDRFEAGRITFDTLESDKTELFGRIGRFYSCLPEAYRPLETFGDHAGQLHYDDRSERLEDAEYWLEQIPA